MRLAICLPSLQDPIGVTYFTAIHPLHRSAEYSIMIGNKEFWGQGLGKLTTRKMVQHGFSDLGLNRIYAYVLEENRRSLSMFLDVGFTLEGTLRQEVYKEGRFQNVALVSLLRSDFVHNGEYKEEKQTA